jgi:hypothetical protein
VQAILLSSRAFEIEVSKGSAWVSRQRLPHGPDESLTTPCLVGLSSPLCVSAYEDCGRIDELWAAPAL